MRLIYLMFIIPCLLFAEKITFHRSVDGNSSLVSWEVNNKGSILYIKGDSEESVTCIECTSDYIFQRFTDTLKDTSQKIEYIREKKQLEVTQEKEGKVRKKSYDLKNLPWVQDFGFGLQPFLSSSDGEYYFYIINPKDLTINEMVAKKQEIATKKFGDQEFEAQKVKITLTGFYSRFWKAELWFDLKTHQLLMYKANEGPSTPTTTLTFKSKV